ncbi:hypothetical protein BLL52_1997 [Rhodoferax antarcticus ANT.BR]|uniref:Uncharacterized protein n=1 Tax=Rhodoferax antarcticus ANT.BR TaxID=1111071 RepID=A0A1Q8YCI7_9BURK|nr:hypothetical protein BLL52_1997 [Rhodoferax antarcticus ANT.BR]
MVWLKVKGQKRVARQGKCVLSGRCNTTSARPGGTGRGWPHNRYPENSAGARCHPVCAAMGYQGGRWPAGFKLMQRTP